MARDEMNVCICKKAVNRKRQAERYKEYCSLSLIWAQKLSCLFFWVPHGRYALEGQGALEAVRRPPNPRPRGTNYEALPSILEQDREGVPMQGWGQEGDMTTPVKQLRTPPAK